MGPKGYGAIGNKTPLAHEVAHVANGDMVTMTLIQGVVNTFVVFLSRIVGYAVDKQINKDGNGQGIGYSSPRWYARSCSAFSPR